MSFSSWFLTFRLSLKVNDHDLKDRGLKEVGGFRCRVKVNDHDLKDRGL
jgi:hypothetical protein